MCTCVWWHVTDDNAYYSFLKIAGVVQFLFITYFQESKQINERTKKSKENRKCNSLNFKRFVLKMHAYNHNCHKYSAFSMYIQYECMSCKLNFDHVFWISQTQKVRQFAL